MTVKISLWSVEYIFNQSISHFGRISNSIEIPLLRRAPALVVHTKRASLDKYLLMRNTIIITSKGVRTHLVIFRVLVWFHKSQFYKTS